MHKFKEMIEVFDARRDIIIPGDLEKTLHFCVEYFAFLTAQAIADHGFFAVALSGGNTPRVIYQRLAREENRKKIDWSRVMLFWSDERSVPPDHSDSNYLMAMKAGFGQLPIPKENIFRMQAEDNIDIHALEYEQLIRQKIPSGHFDLVMLGMGDDGHTASLFPKTHGLHTQDRLVIANYIPHLNTWRMSFTFDCINNANNIAITVMGNGKREMLKRVLSDPHEPDLLPVQAVGTPEHKALWIVDNEAYPN